MDKISHVFGNYAVDKIAYRSAHYEHKSGVYPFPAVFRYGKIYADTDKNDYRSDDEDNIRHFGEQPHHSLVVLAIRNLEEIIYNPADMNSAVGRISRRARDRGN